MQMLVKMPLNSTPEDIDVSAERARGDLEDCGFLGVALVFGCAIGEVAKRASPVFRDLGVHVLFLDGGVVFAHGLCLVWAFLLVLILLWKHKYSVCEHCAKPANVSVLTVTALVLSPAPIVAIVWNKRLNHGLIAFVSPTAECLCLGNR